LSETKPVEEALAEAFTKADALDAPLEARLKAYLADSRRILPDLEATYDQLVKRLKASDADLLVPAVGERLPDFLMTDSEGHLVELSALLRKGPLVISFNRGPWCDYCGLELHALSRAYPEIVADGGEVVSIVPETGLYARALRESRGLPFRVLTDLDLAYAFSLGLVFWVGDKIKAAYRQFGSTWSGSRAMAAGSCRSLPPSSSARTAASRPALSTRISATAWPSRTSSPHSGARIEPLAVPRHKISVRCAAKLLLSCAIVV
jgi:peroxiredoxin